MTRSWSPILPPIKKQKSLIGTFFITNTPSIDEANEVETHVLDHQYSFHWRSWRVWQTRSSSPILPPLMKLKSLTVTFLITNTPSIEETEQFGRHDLDHQYSLHWRNWRFWERRSGSPILPPLKQLKSLTDTFLITNIPSLSEAEEIDWHILDHQYSLP